MKCGWMGISREMRAVVRCFHFHEGNSNMEKGTFLLLFMTTLGLIILRAFGIISFDDPHVASFVDASMDFLKMGASFMLGIVYKGERGHARRHNAKEGT